MNYILGFLLGLLVLFAVGAAITMFLLAFVYESFGLLKPLGYGDSALLFALLTVWLNFFTAPGKAVS